MMINDDKEPSIVRLTIGIKKPIDDKLSRLSEEIGISKTAYILMALHEKLEDKTSSTRKGDSA